MNRSKLGLLGLCAMMLGVMAISASSAQAALSWLVLNSAGTVATELKAEVTAKLEGTSATLLTHLVGLKVGVSCTAFTTTGINLEVGGKLTEGGKVTFTGCTVSEGDTKCTVKSPGKLTGTVESREGKGELVLHTFKTDEPKAGEKVELKEVLTKIEPKIIKDKEGKVIEDEFATLRFEGECTLPEVNKVKGSLFLQDCVPDIIKEKEGEKEVELKVCLGTATNQATTHALEHLIVQGPLTSLTVGADTAEHLETSIDGSALVRLTGAHNGLKWAAMDA